MRANTQTGQAITKAIKQFPSLDAVTSPTVDTAAGAYYLNRRDQTLRKWATYENGPLHPVRINGRLAWSVADIKRLLNGGNNE
jgi:hypothetical protein